MNGTIELKREEMTALRGGLAAEQAPGTCPFAETCKHKYPGCYTGDGAGCGAM